MATVFNTADNNFGVAKWIVNSTPGLGTHTTLAGAMASASAGDTIFLMSSVTENVTITPGVNITAWSGGSANTPSITGTLTMTGAGTSTISGLELITNSAAIIAVTGSAASILNVRDCYLNCSNNTGITYSSSSSSSALNIFNCSGNLGTTGIALFANSSAGELDIYYSKFTNSGGSTTANTISAGSLFLRFSQLFNPITSSSTSTIKINNCTINLSSINTTALTIGGSGANNIFASNIDSGSASCISISSSAGVNHCLFDSTNTNTITGAGTIYYSYLAPNGVASLTINTTTQTNSGVGYGSKNTAPSAGFIGEQIRSLNSSPVSLTSLTSANVTSISLTAGIWDVSGVVNFPSNTVTSTNVTGSISTTSATRGTAGDAEQVIAGGPNASTSCSCVIPSYRITLTATTTVYLVAQSNFTGTQQAIGRISATRVG